ncbi:nuclear transport factor 2 family protein [Shewanella glacialimarina]|jgi:hypothetical protein|uniref:nuclear transport factor 2 family protein n=1 Tax=Shewanella glacialimarina TaxID=2590884 RepID=UPI001CF8FCBB|nr:nuclear transport factor 2 family protein [Shewanella glacialimarina]UCX03448.1 hypothetical protein FJ709_02280 [Shewanella glacialimarina]
MKCILKVGCVAICLILSNIVLAVDCNSQCQLTQIEAYFTALDKMSRKGSSINDIDTLLSLTHDDVEYIHVAYGAHFTKSSWRQAFVRNLERSAYKNTGKNKIRITKQIFGNNYIAIEYSHGIIQQDGTWQATEPLLVLFGFSDDKISLIKELW